jgi:hypothetical protein
MADEKILPTPGAGIADAARIREAVTTAHAETVAKHNGAATAKRPVGRPRKDGTSPNAPRALASVPQSSLAGVDAPAFPPGVVEKAVGALCKTVDRLVVRRTYATAFGLTKDKPLADQFAGDVAMTDEEREQISTLAETVCLQYGMLGQHAPAVFLGISIIGYGTKVYLVLNKLDEIAKFNRIENERRAKQESERTAGPAKN